MHTHTHIYIYKHTHTVTHMHTCTNTFCMHTFTCTHTFIHIHTHFHTHTHTLSHTHIHTHMKDTQTEWWPCRQMDRPVTASTAGHPWVHSWSLCCSDRHSSPLCLCCRCCCGHYTGICNESIHVKMCIKVETTFLWVISRSFTYFPDFNSWGTISVPRISTDKDRIFLLCRQSQFLGFQQRQRQDFHVCGDDLRISKDNLSYQGFKNWFSRILDIMWRESQFPGFQKTEAGFSCLWRWSQDFKRQSQLPRFQKQVFQNSWVWGKINSPAEGT